MSSLFSGFLGQDEAGSVTQRLLPSCSRGFVGFVVPAVFCASELSGRTDPCRCHLGSCDGSELDQRVLREVSS